jgi:hypothetical protein
MSSSPHKRKSRASLGSPDELNPPAAKVANIKSASSSSSEQMAGTRLRKITNAYKTTLDLAFSLAPNSDHNTSVISNLFFALAHPTQSQTNTTSAKETVKPVGLRVTPTQQLLVSRYLEKAIECIKNNSMSELTTILAEHNLQQKLEAIDTTTTMQDLTTSSDPNHILFDSPEVPKLSPELSNKLYIQQSMKKLANRLRQQLVYLEPENEKLLARIQESSDRLEKPTLIMNQLRENSDNLNRVVNNHRSRSKQH